MASTLVEQTRALHEDCERLERLIVRDFKSDAKGHKERLLQNHRVRQMLDQLQEKAGRLAKIYADEDGARWEDIEALKGLNALSTFYARQKEITDYHKKHPQQEAAQPEDDEAALARVAAPVDFSGEEGGGRYLDLHAPYRAFVNSARFGRRLEYLDYVRAFGDDFGDIPREAKAGTDYRQYLADLLAYLEGFYARTQPLGDLAKVYEPLRDFDALWDAGEVPGWADRGARQGPEGDPISIADFESIEELEAIGPDNIKKELALHGLKTGGAPAERAQRLWLLKTHSLAQVPPKHFPPPKERARRAAACKAAALLEQKVLAVREALGPVVAATAGHVEERQARTYEELLAEQAEADVAVDVDSEEEDEYVYNPLKLPLGWDGKPIPFWLYKLHGLNQEFSCEICGGTSYWGRRAFERHFKEWRHQNGMRSLGIPNNKNFFEVTQIEDAKALWESIKEREVGGFKADAEEEFEDAEGNVFNKKTYEDLRRQGLI